MAYTTPKNSKEVKHYLVRHGFSPLELRCQLWVEETRVIEKSALDVPAFAVISAAESFVKRIQKRIKKLPAGEPIEAAIPSSFTKSEIALSRDLFANHPEYLHDLAQIALDYHRMNETWLELRKDFVLCENDFKP